METYTFDVISLVQQELSLEKFLRHVQTLCVPLRNPPLNIHPISNTDM